MATPATTITSALTANAVLDSVFSYQITASQVATGYSASGLPTGVSVNTGTGIISGTPTQAGTFNVTIGATNANGSDSKTLVLSVASEGPLTGFVWAAVGPQSAGALPGPACYQRGGTEPTVTDANVVLGFIRPGKLADGGVSIDIDAAARDWCRRHQPPWCG